MTPTMNSRRAMAAAVGGALLGGLAFGQEAAAQPAPAPSPLQASCPFDQPTLQYVIRRAAQEDSTGLDNDFWAVIVNVAGQVCAVAHSGPFRESQWLGSRQIAAAKAYTANAFSLNLPKGPLSTAQLYGFVQPAPSGGNPLYGLEGGNVESSLVYAGDYATFGTPNDPLVTQRVGGTITFGGGLALYQGNTKVGAIGVSGDTACADHSVAWRARVILGAVGPGTDKLTFVNNATPQTGGHPRCPNDAGTQGATFPPNS
ncbi:heme-binding protein [Methylobacterium sp. ID0610]|uniref:heme-binding protein n=1 Tax=Methylobacterium carpenticola TaxID=3344827 RepID=UPI0036BB2188